MLAVLFSDCGVEQAHSSHLHRLGYRSRRVHRFEECPTQLHVSNITTVGLCMVTWVALGAVGLRHMSVCALTVYG
jgi:hypothetical protein